MRHTHVQSLITIVVMISVATVGTLPGRVSAQPATAQQAARRLSFADVAAAVLQSNLRLRAAAFDVAVAEAQLAQARGARLPQATVTGAYTRFGDRSGQPITITNPF